MYFMGCRSGVGVEMEQLDFDGTDPDLQKISSCAVLAQQRGFRHFALHMGKVIRHASLEKTHGGHGG